MKDIRTLLLGLLSVGLVGTWVYHLYDKSQYSKVRREVFIKDSIAVAQGVQDSLQKIYSATIKELDTRLATTRSDADSLKFQLDNKLSEVNRLKAEINGILRKRNVSKADLDEAEGKITELQVLVSELKTEKASMQEEKERLTGLMSGLSGEIDQLQQSMKKLDEENKRLTEKVGLASVFVASEIQLSPVTLRNDREQETSQAKKVSKFIISFAVQNNVTGFENAEMYIVITQPDGRILKNDDVWEANTFTLQTGRKIPFTRKMRFEYQKGESKKLLFSINAEEYSVGTYTLQLYHNGHLVGQAMKVLN